MIGRFLDWLGSLFAPGRDDDDHLDGCDRVDFADPRFLTSDEDREGFLVPDDQAERRVADGPASPADTREPRLGRGEVVR